ncbi:MAG: sigma-54-dependent transcriptional regulator [Sphingomonadaceae bacterium]
MTDRDEATIILVDDDAAVRDATAQTLELAGLTVRPFPDAIRALPEIDAEFDGAVLSDIRMPRLDGIAFFAKIREIDPELPVVLMTGHGDVTMAVSALKNGAADFVTKPFDADHLVAALRRSIAHRRLVLENRRLRLLADAAHAAPDVMLGDSPAMQRLSAVLRQIARVELDVLIEGETGTGKEIAAILLHRWSARAGRPFVIIDCAALPETVAAEELFGRVDPSGRRERKGRIAAAQGGTLLLDAIDTMSLANQAKLLRVVEDREVLPLGATRADPVDVRVIATITDDVDRAVAQGTLRPDLRFRLDTLRVRIPPLRERGDDVALLFAAFVAEAAHDLGMTGFVITPAIRDRLFRHDWPGNVRELRNFARRAVAGIDLSVLAALEPEPLAAKVARFEKEVIQDALVRSGGQAGKAMAELALPRKTFYDKLRRHGISANRRVTPGGGH